MAGRKSRTFLVDGPLFDGVREGSNLEKVGKRWILALKTDRTRSTYRMSAERFFLFAKSIGEPLSKPRDITKSLISAWISEMRNRERPLSEKTIHGYFMGMQSLLKHCLEENLIQENPAQTLSLPRVRSDKVATRSMSESEVKLLLERTQREFEESKTHGGEGHYIAFRNLLLVSLFLSTAMRVGEVSRILLSDVEYLGERTYVRVAAKRGEWHSVLLESDVSKILREFVKAYKLGEGRFLFPGYSASSGHVNSTHVLRLMQRLGNRAGITWPITPHCFRVTVATIWHYNGAPLEEIQQALRHRSIEMTIAYIKRAEEDREKSRTRLSPWQHVGLRSPFR